MSSSPTNGLYNGKYTLQQLLGRGSLYTTYRATCVGFAQPVVIVELNDSLRQQPDFMALRKAFATEAKRVASCRHPHLIRLLELFLDNGVLYLVMEYIPGQSLTNIVRMAGALTVPQALRYVRQASSALSAMHQRSILHRNLTPQSMIRRQGTESIVITDLGIGREFLASHQLISGMLTPGYAAPEQYQLQAPQTPATDVYGLSAVLYFLLTGQVPTPAPLRDRTPIANVRQFQPHISPRIEHSLLVGMSLDPKERPPTIDAWLTLLTDDSAATPADVTTIPTLGVKPASEPAMATATAMAVASSVSMLPTSMSSTESPLISNPARRPVMATESATKMDPIRSLAAVSIQSSRQFSPARWLVLVSALALLIGTGVGLGFRIWLATKAGVPTLQPEQSFPERQWPNF